jgi:tRNA A37 threonylcarbamoyladenosine biosynthesis protein TsaE
MVPSFTLPLSSTEAGCQRAVIVEIIGPAGAGKTTLFYALEKRPEFHAEFLPPTRDIHNVPFFVKQILLLLPCLYRIQDNSDRQLTRQELAWMAMVMGWPALLKEKASKGPEMLLLEQGPVFLLALLLEFGPDWLRNPKIPGYWEKVMELWAHTMDILVLLDAPDDVLIKRIRTRPDDHEMKDKTDLETRKFLARYRQVYERLVQALFRKNPEIRILQMDTQVNSVEELIHGFLEFTSKREENESV